MRRLIHTALFLLSAGAAAAHLGNENDTEVRVYSDRMQVVVRTSVPFAWTLLGDRAPAVADEAGRAVARPLLIAAASGLFNTTAGGQPIRTTKTDCEFEVENDVAFVLTYARPVEWPVVMNATFFPRLTSLDSGTIRVFDFTASPFNSDLKPLAEGVLHQGNPSLTFSLDAPVPVTSEVKPESVPAAAVEPARPSSFMIVMIALVGSVVLAFVGSWFRSKRRD